ncbi:MAG: ADOP family duplicated permease [Bryobacteraceae bacterium]
MRTWNEIERRLSYLWRRRKFDRELDQEIQFHLDTRVEELTQTGLTERDARAQARREFGSQSRLREDSRGAWQFPLLEDLLADLKYAGRAVRRNPLFAGAAVLSLALGIGVNLAIFSLTTNFLFSQPSVRDSQSLAYVLLGGNSNAASAQYRFIKDAHIFKGLAGVNFETEENWRHGDHTYSVWGARVTENFFDVTGTPILLGRPIHAGEEREAVLSYGFWKGRLGGDPKILGRRLIFDGMLYTVVGILSSDHRTLLGFGFSPDLYLTNDAAPAGHRASVMLYARLPADMTRQIAYQHLLAVCKELDRVFPQTDFKWSQNTQIRGVAGLERLKLAAGFQLAAFFGMLMAISGLVLLIACANVASLLLARAASRQHELAIRQSIGASRSRIVRQLLAESLLLATLGTVAGLLLNLAAAAAANRIRLPLPVPLRLHIQPDWRLLCYAIGLAMASALVCGLLPALRATKANVQAALKLGERSIASRLGFRRVLVIAQIAASVVLLLTGFLFLRNLLLSNSLSPGFDIHHTVWANMRLVPGRYTSRNKIQTVSLRALEQLRTLPGVESAAFAAIVPLNGNVKIGGNVLVDGRRKVTRLLRTANWISSAYFKTMGIPLLSGRDFRPADRKGAPRVVILNQSMARRLFGKRNPIGHTLRFHGKPPVTVIGAAKNSKYFSLTEKGLPAVYWPYAQSSRTSVDLNFLLRSSRPASILKEVNDALGAIDATAAVQVKPMSRAMGLALLPSHVGATLLGSMGVLGLLLAAIGLYSVLTYSVTRRTREIGIRMALGAAPAAVGYMIIRSSLLLVGVGLAVGGVLGYFAASPLAMFLVPGLSSHDPVSLAAVFATLLLVATAATLSPVIRALRVDPMVALRYE